MSLEAATRLAHSLMFEGYVLYPYRQNSLKNQRRPLFGSLYPPAWAEAAGERAGVQASVLVEASRVTLRVLLLHWARRTSEAEAEPAWLEAQERVVSVGPLSLAALAEEPNLQSFAFPSAEWRKGEARFSSASITGALSASARLVAPGVYQLTLRLSNRSLPLLLPGADDAAQAELSSLGAAHLLLHTEDGQFVSLLEPPEALVGAAQACKNDGVWPVLVGSAEARRTMLASPITLYDFPVVAPESLGEYCDSTEIDEMLALRVRTLTEAEKEQAKATDPRARQILERSEALTDEQLLSLHGAWREPVATAESSSPKPGDRVRLRPKSGRDVFDLALAGELATVISLEQDFEGRRYCTVTVDADPGRDLGVTGQPGHRFFFEPDELEPAP
jgi:hypothetical protein